MVASNGFDSGSMSWNRTRYSLAPSIGAAPFFAGSALGYIPQTVVFALLGSGINLEPELRIGASVVLFALSAVLGVHLYRRYRQG